ncbi:hypothetical protein EV193_101815 [Herbihabitans rhizosphaerae]|uniref:DUF6801 domain-containing protein n=1 Tax=Herbihabitans rhizosphaerae TaxID=1872711 RepID=A0A4Q7L6J4_9PSEU|nr:DUF6801 domain-containing protein [Herbihabitans rhizosphaerae]RZS44934.1 hypothetical protein EV193_101815 [Herbihabitans rhizosphaerae]
MEHRRGSRRAAALLAAGTTAILVTTGLLAGSGVGSAEPAGEVTLNYTCSFPMIGDLPVSVTIKTDQPAEIPAGTFTPEIKIEAVSNAGKKATEGLRIVGGETLKGTARATSTATLPGAQGKQTVRVDTTIPDQPIPPEGNDLIVNATGSAPALRFDEPGTATLALTGLELEMTPLRADGTPTELGTFISACTPAPDQNPTLHSYTVTGAPVTPEKPEGVGNHPPLKQTYTCPFPLIGVQPLSVDISATLPNDIKVGEFTPRIDITAVADSGTKATQGLNLVGATQLEGTAQALALVSSPQGHLAVKTPTAIPLQPVPPVGQPLIVNAQGSAPSVVFDKEGTATVSVHDLVMTLTPLKADGTPTGLGTFTADCTLDAGQPNVLQTFNVTPAAPPVIPAGRAVR